LSVYRNYPTDWECAMKRLLIILLVACLPMIVVRADDSDATVAKHSFSQCDAAGGTQSELNACSAEDMQDADRKMNQLYAILIKRLSKTSMSRLRDSQRAWLKFRDSACLYEVGRQEDSGSIWPLAINTCMLNHTRQRITHLEAYVACTDNGCPV
jgi:uncharacterized protein YecT (DUF1311 family)